MKIYIGSDHNGYYLKQLAKEFLSRAGYDVVDDGDKELDPKDDFPIFAAKVVNNILSSTDGDARGILLCGSGQECVWPPIVIKVSAPVWPGTQIPPGHRATTTTVIFCVFRPI